MLLQINNKTREENAHINTRLKQDTQGGLQKNARSTKMT